MRRLFLIHYDNFITWDLLNCICRIILYVNILSFSYIFQLVYHIIKPGIKTISYS